MSFIYIGITPLKYETQQSLDSSLVEVERSNFVFGELFYVNAYVSYDSTSQTEFFFKLSLGFCVWLISVVLFNKELLIEKSIFVFGPHGAGVITYLTAVVKFD